MGEPDVLDLSDSSETTIFYQKDMFSSGFPMMENIRREGKLCDVTLMVGEHSLSAHRIVLAANIPYFRAMFTHNMVESRQSTIPMSCIDSSALESLVNFAYTGWVSISTRNVQNLMLGASFLQLSRVRDPRFSRWIKQDWETSARFATEGPTAPTDPTVLCRQGGHGGADQVQSPVKGPP